MTWVFEEIEPPENEEVLQEEELNSGNEQEEEEVEALRAEIHQLQVELERQKKTCEL